MGLVCYEVSRYIELGGIGAMEQSRALAFSALQVRSITGLSMDQLRYWDRTGFFSPEHLDDDFAFGSLKKVYSFRDLVGLYALSLLRKRYRFSLQQLRPAGRYLHKFHDTPWSSLRLYVVGKQLLFEDPDTGALLSSSPPGQGVLRMFALDAVAHHVERRIQRLRRRRRGQLGRIKQNRLVLHNAPVLRGTRVPTAAVWNFSQAGYSPESIVREYPRLTVGDVKAALAFEGSRRSRRSR
jgi:uncharacterized protein (DUF433 family)